MGRIYLKMKLFAPILVGLTSGSTDGVRQIEMTRSMFDGSRVCGMMTGSGGHMTDNMTLSEGESCIFRIKPEEKDDSTIRLTLIEAADIDCSEYQLNIVDENGVHGPYCREGRHRRGAYSASYPSGQDFMGKEVDMVYSRTAGGGFRFAFNFEFEWELLPGIPGQVQEGYAENTSYGAYGDHGGSSYGGASNGKPSYGKPSGASYGTDAKPAYGKPSGGDGDNKPAPGYAKPTYKPAPKPTYKPATKPTYKPAPKPTYNPPQPTQPPYKPPTQPPQPTQPPYKPPTQPPQKPYNPPKPNKPYKPPMYKPVTNCPWEKPNGLEGDCPANPEMCNLKYFKVCGENFFNKVYNDVCHWQDAAQLIPMVTKMLVPLGARYENKNGKCNGMNYGAKSIQELMGGPVPDSERDVAQCKPVAGAVPCHYIDFSGVTSARTFHLKVEKLYHDFLKQHCNKEWQVHFEALMIRMRNSLFCPDGNSDHEGYMPSPPPPPYVPTKPPTTYKPKPTTAKPYKPPAPKPSYNGGNNNNNNNNGYGDKPVTIDGYTQYPGPMNNKGYCPWNKGAWTGSGYPKDCKKDNKCNLKFAGRCLNNLFNKVYKDICKWQEAGKLQKDINAFFVQLGHNSEKAYNVKCDYSIPQKYAGMRNNRYTDPSMDYYFEDEQFEFEFLDGENPDFADYGRRRRQASRQVPACEKWAGIIPCDLVNFHDAKNELDYYHKIVKVFGHVKKNCNAEWNKRMQSFLDRFKNSMTCPGGFPDH